MYCITYWARQMCAEGELSEVMKAICNALKSNWYQGVFL